MVTLIALGCLLTAALFANVLAELVRENSAPKVAQPPRPSRAHVEIVAVQQPPFDWEKE